MPRPPPSALSSPRSRARPAAQRRALRRHLLARVVRLAQRRTAAARRRVGARRDVGAALDQQLQGRRVRFVGRPHQRRRAAQRFLGIRHRRRCRAGRSSQPRCRCATQSSAACVRAAASRSASAPPSSSAPIARASPLTLASQSGVDAFARGRLDVGAGTNEQVRRARHRRGSTAQCSAVEPSFCGALTSTFFVEQRPHRGGVAAHGGVGDVALGGCAE